MANSYFTVSGEANNTIVIDRSKFICAIKGVEDEDDAKAFIETVRKRFSLANHHCYAYIADDKGLIQKFSDDSEPQGTAGLPMLDVLKSKKMYKTVAVVTRFFGGIKLGTGGLTRAYGGSVSECLKTAKILDMNPAIFSRVVVDYDGYSILLKLLANPSVSVTNTDFANTITVDFALKEQEEKIFADKITNAFNGKVKMEICGSGYHAF